MTLIRIHTEGDTVDIDAAGHAGYAEKGKDIVCAMVSILLQALACWLMDEYPETTKCMADEEAGHMHITFRLNRKSSVALMVATSGLCMLMDTYPDNVRMAVD